ncbi:MAG TPA: RNA chaperone Hfq [Candidatus Ozemobacteraceae bacterium]|nr:RNA chaperone Hfq [Candidatus Ozemobacteraceae bacterium]
MSQYKSQVQNQFLSQARKRHLKVEVILETGTVLRGKLKAYDQFSVSLSFKDKVEIVYKSSIIYISVLPPLRPPSRMGRPMGPRPAGTGFKREEGTGGYRRRPEGEEGTGGYRRRPEGEESSTGYRRRPEAEEPARPLPKPAPRRPFPDFDEDIDNDPPPPKKVPTKRA